MNRRSFILTAGAGVLAGCTVPETAPTFADLTFTDRQPIRLDVGGVEVIDAYRPPLASPNVEHLTPVAPAAAAERWGQDVLRAVGARGRAVFIVLEGSVIETPLKGSSGFTGLITVDQSERYDAALVGRLELFDEADRSLGQAEARATRYQTVAEDVTLNDRQRIWYNLVEATVRDFAGVMEVSIRRDLAAYVR